jgi:hypothetical protein
MQARYPVKVQAIRSTGRTDRFYVFIPLPLAAAIGLEAGEQVQWSLTDKDTLYVRRVGPPAKPRDAEPATRPQNGEFGDRRTDSRKGAKHAKDGPEQKGREARADRSSHGRR